MLSDPSFLGFAGTLALFGAAAAFLKLRERHLVYPGSDAVDPAALAETNGLPGLRHLRLLTRAGETVEHLWHPPAEPGRPVVLFCQGNAADWAYWLERMRFLIDEGHGLLLVGYRGYGGRAGRPSQAGLTADASSARRWLEDQEVEPEAIVYYGISMGSGVASQLAARRLPAALILEAPFSSLAAVAQSHHPWLPVAALVRDKWRSDRVVPGFACPTLVIHGEADEIVPARMGRRLLEIAGERARGLFLPEANHLSCLEFPEARRAVLDLLAEVDQASRANAEGVSTSSSTASSSTETSTTASA